MEKNACMLANGLSEHGDKNIFIFSFIKMKSFYKIQDDVNVLYPIIASNFVFIRYFVVFFNLLFLIIRNRIKIIYSYGETYNAFMILIAKLTSTKIIVLNRASPLSSLTGFRGILNPFAYRFANRVIIQTEKAVNILNSKYSISNFRVIGNPVNIPEVNFENSRENVILNVSSFSGRKNQIALVNCFYKIGNSQWNLEFIGDGPLTNQFSEEIKNNELHNNIRLLGLKTNLKSYYLKNSIFAFTSLSEGFPNALLEAMAHGMAVISYDCICGPSDLIEDGINGFLIENNNEEMFKEKLNFLMNNKDLRLLFGKNAYKKAKEFSYDKIISQFENTLNN
jgi:GalNAc-alpha-(1->4)-GalNAc-alpha-(1->3)-diNAcBac-PP-undecaprenol alpha-1,4-N-acetyl-D-galactosaminyltransferase